MAKKDPIGHIGPCVCCGFAELEVKKDKNGNPYVFCPECSAQVLTHGRPERVEPLLKRMRPVQNVQPPAAPSPPAPAPAAAATPPKSEPKAPAKRLTTLMG
jgi:DNA-directed RNA polymerase subunit RPC12/RpoP